ncbi:MAG: hypothetical protein ACOCNA_04990, partial [Prevotella pectinovora]
LEEMLSDLGILEFSSRILTLLVHSMFLEKGHVPVKLSREKDLCKMQKQLFKSNIMRRSNFSNPYDMEQQLFNSNII